MVEKKLYSLYLYYIFFLLIMCLFVALGEADGQTALSEIKLTVTT